MSGQLLTTPPPTPPDRYARQVIFPEIGREGQERLRAARVLIAGCGALGTRAAEDLARAGTGALRLVDRDLVEWTNLHRQTAFDEADAREGRPKAEALAAYLARVNSGVASEPHVKDMNHRNALDLARGCDLILDGTDNLPTRFLLNDVSQRLGIPWIYAGAIQAAAHAQFIPAAGGPCLRCQLPDLPPPGALPTCDTAGVIGPAAGLAAAWQSALAIRYLVTRDGASLAGRKAILTPWAAAARVVAVARDPDCAACARRRFDALDGAGAGGEVLLCGRDAVQVLPAAGRGPFDLDAAARRLGPLGVVERRGRVVRFAAREGFTLTLFDDGRAILGGLTDTERARSLYARLVGE
jgi:adenylyltransferase/sulfurtransferase